MIVVWVLLIILLFPLFYWYYLYLVKFKDFRKIPGPTSLPLLGCWLPSDSFGIVNRMQEFYGKYKPRYVFYTGFTPRVFHSKPEHIQYIVNSTVHINKSNSFQVLNYWLGEGIITSNGDKWRQRRKILNQSLSMNLMKEFLNKFNKIDDILLKILEANAKRGPVDILELTSYSTLDTTLETLMGTRLNTQENRAHVYVDSTKELLRIIGSRLFSPFFRNETLFQMFSKQKHDYLKLVANLRKFTADVISKKMVSQIQPYDSANENGEKNRYSLMDSLLMKLGNNKMVYEDVREEVDTFMAAGHETSAGLLTFTLYELATHKDIQETLCKEIRSIAPTGDFTMEQLAKMTYLEMVIKETLRLHPIVPYIERQILHEFELDGIKYPVGTIFGVPITCMQLDPEYFPDPYKFDPLRFAPENVNKIPPYVYLPFSAGPRICIGYKYAMWSAKCAIAKCIRDYEFSPAEGFQLKVEYQITLKPAAGVYCQVQKRV